MSVSTLYNSAMSTGTTNANGSEPKTQGQLLALRWRVSNKPWLLRFVRQGCSESVYEGKDLSVY